MGEISTGANVQILISGEDQERAAASVEEQISVVSLEDERVEDSDAAEMQAKMQSVFQQVRNQIRSQVGGKSPKSSILEVVQRLKDRHCEENVSVDGDEKNQAEEELNQETFSAILEKKLEDSKKALRGEFEEQISQVRRDMRAYTDQSLKDLECKMQSCHSPKEQESNGPDRKQKPSTATLSRKGRVLTRTMTTIIPKTCAPVIVGPRAKSETLTPLTRDTSRIVLRQPLLCSTSTRPSQNRKPLPPACPPLHQRKKPVRAKPKTETK